MARKNIDVENSVHAGYYRRRLRAMETGGVTTGELGPEAVLKALIHACESAQSAPAIFRHLARPMPWARCGASRRSARSMRSWPGRRTEADDRTGALNGERQSVSCARRARRGPAYPDARPLEHDARRFRQHLAESHASPRCRAIRGDRRGAWRRSGSRAADVAAKPQSRKIVPRRTPSSHANR